MAKTAATIPMTGLDLDRRSTVPLSRQLYDWLREAILSGQLGSGHRLPSTRTLAIELGVSRNTILLAYDQLFAEGYVEGAIGQGTHVATVLPDTLLQTPAPVVARQKPGPSTTVGPSRRGSLLAETPAIPFADVTRGGWQRPFLPGVPAVDAFPTGLWARIVTRRLRDSLPDLLSYQDPAGYWPLREAVAAYLATSRGVRCTAEQVIIVAGAQSGLDVAARVLLDPGDSVWVEDPGYLGVRGALVGAGARIVPVPVDDEGLDVAAGEARDPTARLVYVTPSHQSPLGATMSLSRRLALLDWASRSSAWIIEDDYDGEYRYAGRPIAALQGLRPGGRVIYVGTFSKILFPALRLGYLVVPAELAEVFAAARVAIGIHAPALEQAALTDFIAEGHFARHVRRMRTLYAGRADILIDAARSDLAGLLDVQPPTTGMHLVGWLPPGVDDRQAARLAAAQDVIARPISALALEPLARGGLHLGFAAVAEPEIRAGVRRLASALRPLVRA